MAYGLSLALVACVAIAVVSLGCEKDSAKSKGPSAELRITRGFGHEVVASHDAIPLGDGPTLLQQLRSAHEVKTAFGDRQVKSIDNLRVAQSTTDAFTWVTNVNGIETDVPPPKYRLYDGDVVQWDYRDWYVTLDVRATVGAFPETFTYGVFGGLFPVKVICERPVSWPCRHVKRILHRAGVPTDGSRPTGSKLPPAGNPQRARVLVGRWERWRQGTWARRIDEGARYSGVFAQFSSDASALRLLDWNAHLRDEEGAGTGLVAAMRPTEEDLMWVVTGVDDVGVERAAQALDSDELQDAFAVAVTDDGVQKLPLEPPR